MSRILAVAIVVGVMLPSIALGQIPTQRQKEILSNALATNGWLTPDGHAEFWGDFPAAMLEDSDDMKLFVEKITSAANVSTRLQRLTWTSVGESLRAGRIVKMPGYEEAKANALALADDEVYRRKISDSLVNAERMIASAASGVPMATRNGTLHLTEELVEEVLSGIDGSIHRLRKLASPKWEWTPTESRYPDAHVTILWDGPFKRSVIDTPLPNGQDVRAVDLKYQLSDSVFVQVTFIELVNPWENPEYAVSQAIQSTLAPLNGGTLTPVPGKWRGHVSASAVGGLNLDSGSFMASARVVAAPEHDGAWIIMAASRESKQVAVRLREGLEGAMRPNR